MSDLVKNDKNSTEYDELLKSKKSLYDIVALYKNSDDELEYVIFTMGDKDSINRYLPHCDGKAVSMKIAKQPLWVLYDRDNSRALFFRATDCNPGFADIKEEDFGVVQYISELWLPRNMHMYKQRINHSYCIGILKMLYLNQLYYD